MLLGKSSMLLNMMKCHKSGGKEWKIKRVLLAEAQHQRLDCIVHLDRFYGGPFVKLMITEYKSTDYNYASNNYS